jgi:hypothetical protein
MRSWKVLCTPSTDWVALHGDMVKPDILNSVREVSWHMQAPTKVHFKAMKQVMAFCISMPERGRVIAPDSDVMEKRNLSSK